MRQPVQEPEKMTQIIVRALEITGQRGIINKGWGGLGNCMLLVLLTFNVIYYFVYLLVAKSEFVGGVCV